MAATELKPKHIKEVRELSWVYWKLGDHRQYPDPDNPNELLDWYLVYWLPTYLLIREYKDDKGVTKRERHILYNYSRPIDKWERRQGQDLSSEAKKRYTELEGILLKTDDLDIHVSDTDIRETDLILRFTWPESWVCLKSMNPHKYLARLCEIALDEAEEIYGNIENTQMVEK
jgi:hypothetical protein